jgi:hypothetical protein
MHKSLLLLFLAIIICLFYLTETATAKGPHSLGSYRHKTIEDDEYADLDDDDDVDFADNDDDLDDELDDDELEDDDDNEEESYFEQDYETNVEEDNVGVMSAVMGQAAPVHDANIEKVPTVTVVTPVQEVAVKAKAEVAPVQAVPVQAAKVEAAPFLDADSEDDVSEANPILLA